MRKPGSFVLASSLGGSGSTQDGSRRIDEIYPKITKKKARVALEPIVNGGALPIKTPKAAAPVFEPPLGGTIVAGDYASQRCVQLRETEVNLDYLQDDRLLGDIFGKSEDWTYCFSGEEGKKTYNNYLLTGKRDNPRSPGKAMLVGWKVGGLPEHLQRCFEKDLVPKLIDAGWIKGAKTG